jgi:hypothetical protein
VSGAGQRQQTRSATLRRAGTAGAGIGTLLTILVHALGQDSVVGQVLLWAIPSLTSASAWAAYHMPRWILFRWDLLYCARTARDPKLNDDVRKQAEILASQMRAERSARVFRRVKGQHLDTSLAELDATNR